MYCYHCGYKLDEHKLEAKKSSFDIVKERFVSSKKLPTSTQYDLEVISAAISIVKYLLTSRALVFDAHLMTPVNDVGSYHSV